MIESRLREILETWRRRWRSNAAWLVALVSHVVFQIRLSLMSVEEARAWIDFARMRLRSLLFLSAREAPDGLGLSVPEWEHEDRLCLALSRSAPMVCAPAGFKLATMERIYALPARPAAPAWPVPRPVLSERMIAGLALGTVALYAGGLLLASSAVVLAHPSLARLFVGAVVGILVSSVTLIHLVLHAAIGMIADPWIVLPGLLALLTVVLFAWAQVERYVAPLVLEA